MKVSSDSINWKYARVFLDTSALLKLLAPELEEPGTKDLESYLKPGLGISIQTGNYCIGEVLGILKRKLNSKSERESNIKQNKPNITDDGYLIVINRLNWKLDNKRLIIYDLPLSKYYTESITFVKKYDIDYVDALILNHLMRSNDYDLFVTDDIKLKQQLTNVMYFAGTLEISARRPNLLLQKRSYRHMLNFCDRNDKRT